MINTIFFIIGIGLILFALFLSLKLLIDKNEKISQEDTERDVYNGREMLFVQFDEIIRDEAIRFAIKLNEFRVTEEDKYKEEAKQILEEIKDKIKESLQVEYEVIEVLFKSYLRNLEAEFLGSD